MLRVLITGGYGYLGGRISNYLSKKNYEVIVCSSQNIKNQDWIENLNFINIEWDSSDELKKICKGVDIIIHAAGMNAQQCLKKPEAAMNFNGLVTSNLLEAAIKAKVKKFFYFSTAHVYDSPLKGIINEDNKTLNKHPYAISNLAGENFVIQASLKKRIKGIVLRISNAFGRPMHKSVNCWMLIINDLCKQVIKNKEIILNSNGKQHRDFIPINNLCKILNMLMNLEDYYFLKPIFNIGSGKSMTVMEVAKLIQKRCKIHYDFDSKIILPVNEDFTQYSEIKYMSNNSKINEINDGAIYNDEIDNLLRFCLAKF